MRYFDSPSNGDLDDCGANSGSEGDVSKNNRCVATVLRTVVVQTMMLRTNIVRKMMMRTLVVRKTMVREDGGKGDDGAGRRRRCGGSRPGVIMYMVGHHLCKHTHGRINIYIYIFAACK